MAQQNSKTIFAPLKLINQLLDQFNLYKTMWTEEDNKLKRSFQFEDFIQAFGFMTQVGIIAEKMNHHPWWSNVYNEVNIELQTHDADNTVTDKDRKLAKAIDDTYQAVS